MRCERFDWEWHWTWWTFGVRPWTFETYDRVELLIGLGPLLLVVIMRDAA